MHESLLKHCLSRPETRQLLDRPQQKSFKGQDGQYGDAVKRLVVGQHDYSKTGAVNTRAHECSSSCEGPDIL